MATVAERLAALEAAIKRKSSRAELAALAARVTVLETPPQPEPEPEPEPVPEPEPPQPPPAAGTPGPTNTGVPAGVYVTGVGVPAANSSGEIVLSTAGATYDGKLFATRVRVDAPTTITRSLIKGPVSINAAGSLTITDSEITGEHLPRCTPGSQGDAAKTTALGMHSIVGHRLNIHHFGKGVMSTGNVTLRSSWLHQFVGGNCDAGGARTHIDGVFVWPGAGNVFVGNFIDAADGADGADIRSNMTAAIFCYHGDVEAHTGDEFVGNRLSGGSYTVYAGDRLAANVKWTDNVFVRSEAYPLGGVWGAVTGRPPNVVGNVWANNTWADNGAVL